MRELRPDLAESSVQPIASRYYNRTEIKIAINKILHAQGITVGRMNIKLHDLLKAKKSIIVSDGATIKLVNDNPSQLDALKTGYKLMGLLGSSGDKSGNQSYSPTLNITLGSPKDLKELKDILQMGRSKDNTAQNKPIDADISGQETESGKGGTGE